MASELDVVNHLLSLERQASPGPWGSGEGCVNGYIDYQARDDERGGVEPLSDYDGREPVATGVGAEDRAFIVAMRNECVRLLTNYAAILNACAAAQVDPARVGEVLQAAASPQVQSLLKKCSRLPWTFYGGRDDTRRPYIVAMTANRPGPDRGCTITCGIPNPRAGTYWPGEGVGGRSKEEIRANAELMTLAVNILSRLAPAPAPQAEGGA